MGTVETVNTNIKVYPIPVSDVLFIEADAKILSVEVYATSGQKVLAEKGGKDSMQISVKHFAEAMYLVKIFTEKETKTVKIIKK